ncbi:hypothetical protein WN944_007535 [Citrus x changshan-huyou]|uniref:Uncharacterized protein n=1 Tax=Citrus x changshan-huyou TaxID=2935761 RepID=A0AAP0MSL3_9ROSI
MNGAEIGIFEETHKIRLRSFLKSRNGAALEPQIGLKILSDFSHEPLERKLPYQKLSALLDKKWEDFFPEWIDEDYKWAPPACPEIPMPAQDYRYLDVIVARVPCRGDGDAGGGVRDVFRLQVNLVVANLAVESGWVKPDVDRAVYVVFVGSCGATVEMFRCDDLVEHAGDY